MAGGNTARLAGKSFEDIFLLSARLQGILPFKIPDGCRRGGKKLIPVKTPFDWILVHQGLAVFVDTKTIEGDRLSFSALKEHQINALSACEERGCIAGYVIYHRNSNVITFAKASLLYALQQGEGVHGKDLITLGTIENFSLTRLFSIGFEK